MKLITIRAESACSAYTGSICCLMLTPRHIIGYPCQIETSSCRQMSLAILTVSIAQLVLYCATCYILCRQSEPFSVMRNGNSPRDHRKTGTELVLVERTLLLPETYSIETVQTALGMVQRPELDPITGIALTGTPSSLVSRSAHMTNNAQRTKTNACRCTQAKSHCQSCNARFTS